MLNNNPRTTLPQTGKAVCASSAKRALVNVILTNGFVARLSQEELEDRSIWED